ncbi:MAG: hypothetical protein IJK26_09645 [Clostridia bacterium]|nr:hypothetical protein [Clostridia bacterium]
MKKNKKKKNAAPQTFYIQSREASRFVKDFEKSPHYRSELKYLIGKKVTLRGKFVKSNEKYIPFCRSIVSNVLVQHIRVMKVPDWFSGRKFSVIDHIWIITEREYLEKHNMEQGMTIDFTGILYEYAYKGKKNISLKLLEAKPSYPKDERRKGERLCS